MKILVTGGAGYIGSVTTHELLNRGFDVVVIDNLSEGHLKAVDQRATFIEGNIGNPKTLKEALLGQNVGGIMHFAASSLVSESMENPSKYFQNNILTSIQLLEAAREYKIKKFIFSSSCAIYGEPAKLPIVEDTPKHPSSPYGETKLAFEGALKWYSQAYDITSVSLRYFNAAGATEDLGEHHGTETHLIPNVIKAIQGQIPYLNIFGTDYPTQDGTCIRDYIHIRDIAEAHILALEYEQSDAFNLGNGNGYSVKDVIETLEKISGKSVPQKENKRRPGDPPCLIAKSSRIYEVLGWAPKYPSLESIIQSAWDWHQKYPNGYNPKKSAEK